MKTRRYRTLKLGQIFDRIEELVAISSTEVTDVITLTEMAQLLQVSKATLRKWVQRKEIIGHVAGNGKIYFLKSDMEANMLSKEQMLTCHEISEIMGVSSQTVSHWIRTGKLVARKFGNKWLITPDDWQDFLDIGFMS